MKDEITSGGSIFISGILVNKGITLIETGVTEQMISGMVLVGIGIYVLLKREKIKPAPEKK